MTCNTEFDSDNDSAKTVIIRNIYGSESLKVSEILSGNWNEIGTPSPPPLKLFTRDESDPLIYKSEITTQSCGAKAQLWSTTNGVADNANLNARYFDLKEGGPLQISSGFRVWETAYSSTPIKQADAPELEYSLFDFKIEKPETDEEGGYLDLARIVIVGLLLLISICAVIYCCVNKSKIKSNNGFLPNLPKANKTTKQGVEENKADSPEVSPTKESDLLKPDIEKDPNPLIFQN